MENVTYIKGVRTRFLNILKKEISRATEILKSELPENKSEIEEEITNCDVCLEKLSTYREKLENQSEKLCIHLGDSESELLEKVIEEDTEICDTAIECCVRLKRYIDSLATAKQEGESVKVDPVQGVMEQIRDNMKELFLFQMQENKIKNEEENASSKQTKNKQTVNIKLPKLELLSFNGDKTKWLEFWDSFETSIHRNSELSDIDKFNYLRSKLSGVARDAISGYALSNRNYPLVIAVLKERFGNIQEIVKIHYDKLLALRPATNKVNSLRSLMDYVNRHLRSLQVLGQDIEQEVFVSMLWSKLPDDVLLQIQMKAGVHDRWTVTKLLEYLHEYVIARERIDSKGAESQKQGSGATGYTKKMYSPEQSSPVLVTKPDQSLKDQSLKEKESYKSKCRYCQKSHWSDECGSYKTIYERKRKLKNSCFNCLKEGHKSTECKSNKACVYCGEHNAHHRSLCPKKFAMKPDVVHLVSENDESATIDGEENALLSANESVSMQTATCSIQNPETQTDFETRILLDSGSQRTYITERVFNQLGLKVIGEDTLNLVTFGSSKVQTVKTKRTIFKIKTKDGEVLEITANVVPVISGTLHRKALDKILNPEIVQIFKSVDMADSFPTQDKKSPIDVLIGNDFYLDIVMGKRIELQPGLFLLSSRLGWILSGRIGEVTNSESDMSMLIFTQGNLSLTTNTIQRIDPVIETKPDLEDFWKIESIGIYDQGVANEDKIAHEQFKESLLFENGRYQVQWPWKNSKTILPENRELAVGRLRSTTTRLKKNPELFKKYSDIILDQLSKGVIEKVKRNVVEGMVHYIPHHPVVTPQKTTTKVRIVYDASAKTRESNKSLNECLLRGPVLLHDLCGILVRFRLHRIAIVSDIEKAFLQIGLQKDQRDVTRFLWLKDLDNASVTRENIQEYRFTRVPFGVISSPFLLGATVNFHLESYDNDIAKQLKGDIYVDNVITGCDSVEEGCKLYKDAKHMFNEASMNLREWVCSDAQVYDSFDKEDQADISSPVSVLGNMWNVKRDTMSLKPSKINPEAISFTKRGVVKAVASLFDPLGLFSPVTLDGKLFIQCLWTKNLNWDDPIPDNQRGRWDKIAKDILAVPDIVVPRCVSISSRSQEENRLVCFCDASKDAYSTCIYLHQTTVHGCKSNLIFSKTRVAPLKQTTIPRLELMAVVIGIRCVEFLKGQIKKPIQQVFMWSDSKCVLHWISSSKSMDTFVKNRVVEIKKLSKGVEFRYVPSAQNPADIATRGLSAYKLRDCKLWWNGPDWLQDRLDKWPIFDNSVSGTDESESVTDSEVTCAEKSDKVVTEHVMKSIENEYYTSIPEIIDIERFSSVTKLFRVTVIVNRFIQRIRKAKVVSGCVTSRELDCAELAWIEYEQRKYYPEEFMGRKTNLTRQLGLKVDDRGLIVCLGRMENTSLTESARKPILLPKASELTRLIIDKCHRDLLHSGVSQTLSRLRQQYWVPHGRAMVKSTVRTCGICKRFEGGPFKLPPMAPYPKSRVSESSPFERVGVDYFGPMTIKTNEGPQKVWICLFTCFVTRAIHLELVLDLSTEEFLMCIRRFISQRGVPVEIFSDNATQFRAASTTFDRLWLTIVHCEDVQSYVADKRIAWIFNVELAPWMGGFYERLIGIVKRTMRKSIGRKLLTVIQLQTYIKEVEAVVNSRPLVYVGDDINSTLTLTPAHFLSLNPKTGICDIDYDDKDPDYHPNDKVSHKLLDMWIKGQKMLEMFWNLWRNEYLTSLRERPSVLTDKDSSLIPKIGDIVLLKDDIPRGYWRIGKVVELKISKDTKIRSAKVMVANGRVLGRPLNMLYPLEVSQNDVTVDNSLKEQNTIKRTQRAAATIAKQKLKRLC